MFLLRELLPGALTAGALAAGLLALCWLLPAEGWRLRLAPWPLALAFFGGLWVLGGRPHFPPAEALDWLGPIAFLVAALATIGLRFPAGAAAGVAVAGTGVCAALALSGSLRLAELAGLATAASVGAIWFDRRPGLGSALLVPAALLEVLVRDGRTLAELPTASAWLLGAALLVAIVPLGHDRGPVRNAVRQALLPGLLAVAAVFLAYRASPSLDY